MSTFSRVSQRHFNRICNLRITYPKKKILLWDDDVSGAFRWSKYHPNLAASFAFIFAGVLYIHTGHVFGGNTSANNFEPIDHARCLLAKQLSSNKSLIKKHWSILKNIKFERERSFNTFSTAHSCSQNIGVIHNGVVDPTEHNMFVDDSLIAEIDDHMLQAMSASIEALFLVTGPDKPEIRRSNLSMDKFYQATCDPVKEQLGIIIDTNKMIVKMTPQKIIALKTELVHCHSQRKSFTLKQIATLLGTLDH